MSKRKFLEVIVIISLTIAYGLNILYNAIKFYTYIKDENRQHGRIYQVNEKLGFDIRPSSNGYFQFPGGVRIPMDHDAKGFRISTLPHVVRNGPKILALGSSFTYGHACPAEETFPNIVADKLGGEAQNGGVCGYSLAQMHLKARELIPLCKPTYALIEYAVWMPERSQNPLWQSNFGGAIPGPYYYKSNGFVLIHSPPYLSRNFDIPLERYEKTAGSILNFFDFLLRVSIPLNIYNDVNTVIFNWKKLLKIIPPPTADLWGVHRAAFRDIAKLCQDNGTHLIIVGMTYFVREDYEYFMSIPNITIVRGRELLEQRIGSKNDQDYLKYYGHWDRSINPPKLLDAHPNPLAHKFLAEAIVASIMNTK